MLEEVRDKTQRMERECRSYKDRFFLGAGQEHKAIFGLIRGLEERTFARCGFTAEEMFYFCVRGTAFPSESGGI